MVGWHHRLNGPEFEQAPGDGGRQGGLVCRSPWGHKELDTTGKLTLLLPLKETNPDYPLEGLTLKLQYFDLLM